MNESILFEALKDIRNKIIDANYPEDIDIEQLCIIATEAIKKWEDSSGKETGMKWVKASERLPDDKQKLKRLSIKYNGQADALIYREDKWHWWDYSGVYQIVKNEFWPNIEWLDESVPPYKEEEHKNYEEGRNKTV